MTVKMAVTFQNGRHENIKQCIYISYCGEFLCTIHALIGFQGQRIIFDTFKLKMMFIFKMMAIYRMQGGHKPFSYVSLLFLSHLNII